MSENNISSVGRKANHEHFVILQKRYVIASLSQATTPYTSRSFVRQWKKAEPDLQSFIFIITEYELVVRIETLISLLSSAYLCSKTVCQLFIELAFLPDC